MRCMLILGILFIGSTFAGPTADGAIAAVTTQPPIREYLKTVSDKLYEVYKVYNELAELLAQTTDEDEQHTIADDQSKYLLEQVRDLKHSLNELIEKAKLYNGTAGDDAEFKIALKQLHRAVDVFVLEEKDILRFGIDLKKLHDIVTDKDVPKKNDENDYMGFVPDIISTIQYSDNEEELKYYWIRWRFLNSRYAASVIQEVADLLRQAAKLLEIPILEFWNAEYKAEFLGQMDDVMKQLEPFYKKLHGYARYQLIQRYGVGVIKPNGPIPDHLFEQMLLRNWKNNIIKDEDFKDAKLPDYDSFLEVDANDLIKYAEDFYVSMGFQPLSEDFRSANIIPRYEDGYEPTCVTTVQDMTPNASMHYCYTTGFKTLMQMHTYVGRLHYAILKKDLPAYYFEGYKLKYPVGEAVILAASSPAHLNRSKIIKGLEHTDEMMTNRNLRMAIHTMFNIPRYYVLTKLMTGILDGSIEMKDANNKYWELMEKHAGVEPPADRFDGALDLPYNFYLEINGNKDMTSRFASEILGYQFYKALCQKAGHVGELYDCDFSTHKEAGDLIKKMMSLGSSKPWHEVIGVLLPQNAKLDGQALLDYYEPVSIWLNKKEQKVKYELGWVHTRKKLSADAYLSENEAKAFVEQASDRIYKLYDQLIKQIFEKKKIDASNGYFWILSDAAVAMAELKDISMDAKKYIVTYKNETVNMALNRLKQIADILVLGKDIDVFLQNRRHLYDLAFERDIKIYEKRNDTGDEGDSSDFVAYDPYIKGVLLNSTDAAELKYYWEKWRAVNEDWAKNRLYDILDAFEKAATILEISVSQFWFKQYSSEFIDRMEGVIEELKPFYTELHAFIRSRLEKIYPDDVSSRYPIPDHLYQQVLAQAWANNSVIDKYFPYSALPPTDEFIREHKYNGLKLLEEAEKFFQSLGFEPLEETFWKQRLVVQDVEEYEGQCQAAIFDMIPTAYMKYCEKASFKAFLQAHGYLARIHYANEKRHLPAFFFDTYFLEYPVGEAIILSAASPKHMKTIGLAGSFEFTEDVLLNRLFRMGIHTMLKIHMHFVHAKVVNDYLIHEINRDDLVKHYWQTMIKYAGVEPPSDRFASNFDFPYEFYIDLEENHATKKFVSEVFGYQFYDAFCTLSGHEGPLHNCDFFGNKDVGVELQKMMRLGSSTSWKNILKTLIKEQPYLSSKGILKYYAPLYEWLKKQNDDSDEKRGFGVSYKKILREEIIYDPKDD